ncbi:MAG: T9SS type A sorting domain-containing protein, partial [Bacteroidia bacterium]
NSVMSGLTVGVQADFTSGGNRSANVLNTTFTNIPRNVTFNYSKASQVSGNTIVSMPNAVNNNASSANWGIRMNNVADYALQWNTISGASASTLNNYGVIVDNGLNYNSQIGSNTFSNVYAGIQAQGNNGTASTGVRVTCNTFNAGITYQFVVCPQVSGSIANQGSSCSSSVKNTFSAPSVSFGQVYSPLVMFVYYAANGSAPTSYSSNVSLLSCAASVNCPTPDGYEVERVGSFESASGQEYVNLSAEQEIENLIAANHYAEASQKISAYSDVQGKSYYEVALSIARQGGNWFLMTESEIEIIQETAAGSSPQQLSAQCILRLIKDIPFERNVERISNDADLFADSDNNALLENRPNPFTDNTVVHCKVDVNAQNAQLVITNTLGEVISRHRLSAGVNMVTISNDNMVSGIYYCSLIVDGELIAARKMLNISK